MKRLCALLLCLMMCSTAWAEAPDRVGDIIEDILSYEMNKAGVDSIQAWLDGPLADAAGKSAEWYVIALSQWGTYDFTAYQAKLRTYLAETTVRGAVTRQKYAMALHATGAEDAYIQAVMEDSIGQQGIMSWAYGLHLMNLGCTSKSTSAETIIEQLLSLQLPDGGWALNGTVSDVDVTAMVLQALAPHAQREDVSAAVADALQRLSQCQLDDGGFASYGTPNPESAAQVMIALCKLGIDPLQDARFIKKDHTILDGMARYQLPEGAFSHTMGGAANGNATVQVLGALVGYQRMLGAQPAQGELPAPLGYKPVAVAAVVLLALLACGVLLLKGKRHPKNFLAVGILAGLLAAGVLLTDFQSAEEYYGGAPVEKPNAIGTVTMEIRCNTVAGRAAHIPADGVLLPKTAFAIAEGDTVYDILAEAAQQYSLHMESSGAPGMIYIAGLGHVYEFDFGDLSGWMVFVNGESLSASCDQYQLADGDSIRWLYSCDMGSDLK